MSKAETKRLVDNSAMTELGPILFEAKFEMEDVFMRYRTWVFWGAFLILLLSSCGILLPMGFWVFCTLYAARVDYNNRRLYITPDYVVYNTRVPSSCLPCCGINTAERHIMLSLITDVCVTQSWFQSCFGIEMLKIENAGQGGVSVDGKPTGSDLAVDGISNCKEFKRALLATALAKRQGREISAEFISQAINSNNYTEVVGTALPAQVAPSDPFTGAATSSYPRAQPAAHVMGGGSTEDTQEIKASLQEMNNTLRQVATLLADQAKQRV